MSGCLSDWADSQIVVREGKRDHDISNLNQGTGSLTWELNTKPMADQRGTSTLASLPRGSGCGVPGLNPDSSLIAAL